MNVSNIFIQDSMLYDHGSVPWSMCVLCVAVFLDVSDKTSMLYIFFYCCCCVVVGILPFIVGRTLKHWTLLIPIVLL